MPLDKKLLAGLILVVSAALVAGAAEHRPHGNLKTRWAEKVDPDAPLPEHPRPSLQRVNWTNLNGRWDYAIIGKDATRPEKWDGKIVVPFCAESQLSGVQRFVGAENRLWYRRCFATPEFRPGERVMLRFGAVDWDATVWINGKELGNHKGGYDPFSFDVTDAFKKGENELVVSVWDPTDSGPQPRGKQVGNPRGIFYTAVTGIWQTVWLEVVPEVHLACLNAEGDPQSGELTVSLVAHGDKAPAGTRAKVDVLDEGKVVATALERRDATNGRRPNVLFIAIDDMNDWTTLFDEDNPIRTPNLKRLAARGMFFSRAYCAVPGCNPSRTAIMTGYSPQTSRCYTNGDFGIWRQNGNVVTLPQYFRNHGYAARGAGKIFHHGGPGRGDDPRGTQHSWDDFQKHIAARKQGPNYNGYRRGTPDIGGLAATCYDWGEHQDKMVDYDTVEYAEKVMAEKWDKPMFLAAGIFKPHLPFYAPPDVFTRYPIDETKIPPMPANDLDDVPPIGKRMAHTEFFVYSNVIKHESPDPRSIKRMVQCYQASADFADSMVGRLLDALHQSGRADNTIIILWADHGYHLGDKESCVKFTLWEKANHVPFIIVAPGVTKPGSVCDEPVTLLNIYPTLLELCGLPPKADNDGHSLVPLLRNPDADWPHPAIMTQGEGNHALRTDRWRYIRYRDGSKELYDHENDPWEWKNLAGEEKYAELNGRLGRKLEAALRQNGKEGWQHPEGGTFRKTTDSL